MRRSDIQPGAEVYFVGVDSHLWRLLPPTRAIVIDPGPFRIVCTRAGAAYVETPVRDDKGSYVRVYLCQSGGMRERFVHRRFLRGLWQETLEKTGRTEEGVALHQDGIRRAARSSNPLEALLRLATEDPHLPDGALGILAQAADGGDVKEVGP